MAIDVLVIDDSALVRQVLLDCLSGHPSIAEIQVAPDPIIAMMRMENRWPDVIILDLDMPKMDGLTFLEKLQGERPTPVIVCSGKAQDGSADAMRALELGAFAVIAKPSLGLKSFLQDSSEDIWSLVQAAVQSKPSRLKPIDPSKRIADVVISSKKGERQVKDWGKIIAIGCSTGGTIALETILSELPREIPGVVIVQHMPEMFTKGFAQRLNNLSRLTVMEGADHLQVEPGFAYIAPGGKHMVVKRRGAGYFLEVLEGPLVSRHRPSVDVLFRSVAKAAGANAIGFILTGMGDDGARGIKDMNEAGAQTFAQNEDSCVVFGMPKEAIRLNAIDYVVPLEEIPACILQFSR